MSASPTPVCIGCGTRPVGIYELICGQCRPALERAGLITPQSTLAGRARQRAQAGNVQRSASA